MGITEMRKTGNGENSVSWDTAVSLSLWNDERLNLEQTNDCAKKGKRGEMNFRCSSLISFFFFSFSFRRRRMKKDELESETLFPLFPNVKDIFYDEITFS